MQSHEKLSKRDQDAYQHWLFKRSLGKALQGLTSGETTPVELFTELDDKQGLRGATFLVKDSPCFLDVRRTSYGNIELGSPVVDGYIGGILLFDRKQGFHVEGIVRYYDGKPVRLSQEERGKWEEWFPRALHRVLMPI